MVEMSDDDVRNGRKRILVADDHEVVREGIKGILARHPDLEVAGEASDAPEVLRTVREDAWDLVLLDLSLPTGEGLETLRRVRSAAPELPVLILSVHPEEEMAARLLEAGAMGYVQKDAASGELVHAIRRVLEGRKYLSSDMASRLAEILSGGSARHRHEELSDREFQVLRLLGEGHSVSDIADILSLSVKTVSTYRSRLLEKLGMRTTAQLIRYALEHDLVQ